ncbi:MAG: tautomerase family protein [Clostridia bacterium]
MPYIAMKTYRKDAETKKRVVEKINRIFLEEWGCPPEAISISLEEFTPEEFDEKVSKTEIELKKDAMMILFGKKCY